MACRIVCRIGQVSAHEFPIAGRRDPDYEVFMAQSPDVRWKQRFNNYRNALKQFEEGVRATLADRISQEGLIQRFEYTFELAWKCLQDVLQSRGYAEIRGPKPVIEQAFQDGLIADGLLWMEMLKARNEAAHLYDEAVFLRLYDQARHRFLAPLQSLAEKLRTL